MEIRDAYQSFITKYGLKDCKPVEPSAFKINIDGLWKEQMLSAGCTSEEIDYTANDYKIKNEKQQEFLKIAKENISANFILYGKSGTGKSHLALMILKKRLQTEDIWRPKYITLWEMQTDILTDWSNLDQTVESYCQHDILIIDECDKVYKSNNENERRVLNTIIDKRHRTKKQTIFITNDLGFFTDYLTGAAIDRLKSTAILMHFDWDSYRRKKGELNEA